MSYLVIRARSDRGVTRKIRETMSMLNLTRVNHATIVMDNPSYRGMLQKSKDYITWGEVDANTIEKLIKERSCKIKKRDRRVFQDGIYIVSKGA